MRAKQCFDLRTPESGPEVWPVKYIIKPAVTSAAVHINSQVHNLQKLKNISLKAVNFLATKTKVTCLSERVIFYPHIPE